MGDINGVGPEILIKALGREDLWKTCRPLVYGSCELLNMLRAAVADCPAFAAASESGNLDHARDMVPVIEADALVPDREPGEITPGAGGCAAVWLLRAAEDAMAGKVQAIVTCPISKEGLNLAGYRYMGHTDLLADRTGAPEYWMSLFAGDLRIVHITGHMPLREAVSAVKKDRIVRAIQAADKALRSLHLERRRIAVAGLNPHAGEGGLLGGEEIEEIGPAVERCRSQGIDCSGPFPPDAVFRWMCEGAYDLVVAMYHDQGHIPLKLVAMDQGVNVTLGLPITRTSVDHGTAYDIAGTWQAREDSLMAAIKLAAQMCPK